MCNIAHVNVNNYMDFLTQESGRAPVRTLFPV